MDIIDENEDFKLRTEIEKKKLELETLESKRILSKFAGQMDLLFPGNIIQIKNPNDGNVHLVYVKIEWARTNLNNNCIEVMGRSYHEWHTAMYDSVTIDFSYCIHNIYENTEIIPLTQEDWDKLKKDLVKKIDERL